MSWLAALHAAGGLVLALAGLAKLRHPVPTGAALHAIGLPSHLVLVRGIGLLEVALGVAAAWGAQWVAWLVGAQWAALAVVAVVLVRRPHVPCGCFGEAEPTPVTAAHVAVDVAFAAIAFATAGFADADLVDATAEGRGGPVVVLALVTLLAVLVRALLTDLPALRAAVAAARP